MRDEADNGWERGRGSEDWFVYVLKTRIIGVTKHLRVLVHWYVVLEVTNVRLSRGRMSYTNILLTFAAAEDCAASHQQQATTRRRHSAHCKQTRCGIVGFERRHNQHTAM